MTIHTNTPIYKIFKYSCKIRTTVVSPPSKEKSTSDKIKHELISLQSCKTPISAVADSNKILEPPNRKNIVNACMHIYIHLYTGIQKHIPSGGWCSVFIILDLIVRTISICVIIQNQFNQYRVERNKGQKKKVTNFGSLPSSGFAESSHIKETLETEIEICRGFLNSISTFNASANRWRRRI